MIKNASKIKQCDNKSLMKCLSVQSRWVALLGVSILLTDYAGIISSIIL